MSQSYDWDEFVDSMGKLVLFIVFGLLWNAYPDIEAFYRTHPYWTWAIVVFFLISIAGIALKIHEIREERWLAIKTIEDMHKLHWREFEVFISFVLRKKWFKTRLWPGYKDGWIDITGEFEDETYLIQCKRWSKFKISEPNMREFFGSMKAVDPDALGIYVTTSVLTKDAEEFADKVGIEIWDENSLESYVREFLGKDDIPEDAAGSVIGNEITDDIEKVCPKCGSRLILRKSRRGSHRWESFYGCETFPKCRFLESVDSDADGV